MERSLIEVILSNPKILNMDSLNHKIHSSLANLKEMMISIRLIRCKHQLTFKIRGIKMMINRIIKQNLKMVMIWKKEEKTMMI